MAARNPKRQLNVVGCSMGGAGDDVVNDPSWCVSAPVDGNKMIAAGWLRLTDEVSR
jgi:hypothetical protein